MRKRLRADFAVFDELVTVSPVAYLGLGLL